MERAALVRCLLSSSLDCTTRFFPRSPHRLSPPSLSSPAGHLSPALNRRSLLRPLLFQWRLLPPSSPSPSRLHFRRPFSSLSPRAIATLPTQSSEGLPLKHPDRALRRLYPHYIPHVPTEVGYINGTTVLQHRLDTNETLYIDIVFDMSSLKQELLPLVPPFCWSLMEMRTKKLKPEKLHELIEQKTGGISIFPFTSSIRGREDPCIHLIVRGKAIEESVEDLFTMVNCILQEVQFTDQRCFRKFVSESKERMENQLRGSGHAIAAVRMDAKLNVAGWISEQMGGVSYLEFLQALEEKVDQDWAGISSSLEEIRKSLLSRKNCLINMTSDENIFAKSEQFVSKFLDLLPSESPVEKTIWNAQLSAGKEAIVIPTEVNYVGKAANIYDTGYQFKGSAHVISKYISNTWLWDRVRVRGGAYGGFCDFDTQSGVLSFLSYRDPNLLKTLDVYDGTGDFLRELEMDDDTLTKAIIETNGDADAYRSPDAKAYSSLMRYLLGVTEEERQRRREEISSTSLKDLREFADAIAAIKDGVVVVVASADDVDAANKERSNFFQVKRAL